MNNDNKITSIKLVTKYVVLTDIIKFKYITLKYYTLKIFYNHYYFYKIDALFKNLNLSNSMNRKKI